MASRSMERVRLGRWGEERAGEYLRQAGYRILTTNYRCPWGEVDLVAQDGKELVFVEVRTRRSLAYGPPQESITAAKAAHLRATAQDYIQRHGPDHGWSDHDRPELNWRIDLVSIQLPGDRAGGCGGGGGKRKGSKPIPGPLLEHIKYAVEL